MLELAKHLHTVHTVAAMGSDNNSAEGMAIDDDNEEAAPPSEPPQQMLTKFPDTDLTNERELKKLKLAEVEDKEEDEGRKVAIAALPLAMAAPTSSDDEETIDENPHPIGKLVRVSGKGTGRRKHYKSFGYDGKRYDLEDPVLLAPYEPNQKPDLAIIKDITQTKGGRMMVIGQRFYRPGEAEKKDGGFWQSNNTRELFYSFHKDKFPAESVMHRFVVHFIPPKMQIPPRTEHPGFIVQRMYHAKRKLLFKLKDAGANKEEEIDLLVQKTKSRLGNLPNIQPKDAVAH
ncbi:ASI1-immunoprecipitated protein 3 [Coffea arabica]|uniref:ASI1-immunoprecipitated protein 3 n=1 Tax=Coffea arabica TaxID=13443 RepID=A0A6P6SI21_COFAR|nr:uncharacterized protein LOC113691690 [Coffea arabica]